MSNLILQCIFVYIIWCSTLMVCRTTSEVTRERRISRLIDEMKVSKFQASALIISHPRRMLGYSKYQEIPNSDVHLNARILKNDPYLDIKRHNRNMYQPSIKNIQPTFGHVLFGKADTTLNRLQRSAESEIRSNPSRESFTFQELHLRYLMSSTAEQPDNSGRTSTFSMWLTILIAALAAAILS